MFVPNSFVITDQSEIDTFIEVNAFGQLISFNDGELCCSHLPFLLNKDKTKLMGHLALANPQHRELKNQQVLITLSGAHDYISPSWYSSSGVPTWNYQALHIYGRCDVFFEVNKIKELLDTLTEKYESVFPQPWRAEYSAEMLDKIVGVEITIDKIQCKYKLSQNRSTQDRKQVIQHLENGGSKKLAKAMRSQLQGG